MKSAISVTIPAGASVSDAADLGDGLLCMIAVPPGFAGDALAFQVSHDGTEFRSLREDMSVRAGCAVPLARPIGGVYLRVRANAIQARRFWSALLIVLSLIPSF